MHIQTMNAHIGSKDDLNRKDMIFEPKYDGIRALCYVNKSMKFISRNGIDRTAKHPEFQQFRKKIKAHTCILDGEIVAYDKNGRPDFSLLQRGGGKLEFVVFDILMKEGKILTALPLTERKKILAQTVTNGMKLKRVVSYRDGKKLWRRIVPRGFEGVMAKTTDGHYYPGKRSFVWLKIKALQTVDCVIVGYTQKKRLLSSLVVALYDRKGELHYIGHVGTGFSEETVASLHKKLSKIKIQKKPIANDPVRLEHIQWISPRYVAEVSYLEFTRHKRLRAPAFERLRSDKKPKECTFSAQAR